MKLPPALAAVLFLAPFALSPAADDSIRGFDPPSRMQEVEWERQARDLPDAVRIGETIRRLSRRPHLAGTAGSKRTADALLAELREYGLDAHAEQFEAMLPLPKTRLLEMTAPTHLRMKLEEPGVNGDPASDDQGMVPAYNAYSADGDVTAPLVYVNYGLPSDYDLLRDRGIDVRGRIVIARYGRSFRGTKPKVAAEHGAVGCIIYSDPRDDGYFQGDVYPRGPFRPAGGVQRGSVLDLTLYTGDPLSPGWASEPGSARLKPADAATLMKIPVLPISYGDALPLLEHLEGPVAPESWRGALPVTYHLGPGGTTVHLKVEMDNGIHPLYDVIARIPGSESPDEWVLDGNHHDAWAYGASDPLSGAAPLLETARTLAQMVRRGWKPRRTILIAFWDGEEFGLLGSTEWMEKHADELNRSLVAYINGDSNGRGGLGIGGSHTLEAFAQELTRDVNEPVTGHSLLSSVETPGGEFHIAPLGSGSDYTPFLQHLGVATLDMRFASNDAGVYHSDYDNFNWYSHFSDTNFVYGRALSQLQVTALMRLAGAALLPFEFGRFAWTVSNYLDQIEKLTGQPHRPYLESTRAEILRMHRLAGDLNGSYVRVLTESMPPPAEKLHAVNTILLHTERTLATDPGLPGRPWFRHRIYAPGMYTGYDAKTLPGIREAIEGRKPDEAAAQAEEVAGALHGLNEDMRQAERLLEGM